MTDHLCEAVEAIIFFLEESGLKDTSAFLARAKQAIRDARIADYYDDLPDDVRDDR
jgi:HEAT repeat protein